MKVEEIVSKMELEAACGLYWYKIRCDNLVRRILIKHGAIPNPLAHAKWP